MTAISTEKEVLDHILTFMDKTIAQLLDIRFISYSPEKIVATMPVDHRTHQPDGVLHGGASVVLAETVASVGGAISVWGQGKTVVGQEINANHVRAVRNGLVTAIGTPLHQGRSSQIWDIKLYDDNQRLVCVSRCTLAVRDVQK